MKETTSGIITIDTPGLKPEIFRTMLEWIYSGECEMPEDCIDLVSLLNLADEYLMDDLR